MSQHIVILAHCRNPYDHTKDIEYDFYYGSTEDCLSAGYLTLAERRMKEKTTGWYSMTAVDTHTSVATKIFYKENPLKERVELNVPAKAKQAMSVRNGSFNSNNLLEAIAHANASMSNPFFVSIAPPPPPPTMPMTHEMETEF